MTMKKSKKLKKRELILLKKFISFSGRYESSQK